MKKNTTTNAYTQTNVNHTTQRLTCFEAAVKKDKINTNCDDFFVYIFCYMKMPVWVLYIICDKKNTQTREC